MIDFMLHIGYRLNVAPKTHMLKPNSQCGGP